MTQHYEYRGIKYYTESHNNYIAIFDAATHQFVYQLHGSDLSEEEVFYKFLNQYLRQD